ncbi:efflux transporter periplasmic adaptor subunit, partial [Paenibacillus sp. TAF58]
MPKKLNRIVLPTLGIWIMAGLLSGCSLLPVEEPELNPPLVQPLTESLTLFEVKKANIAKQITGVATFASDQMDYLFYKESGGRLTSMNVKLGDKVHAGDVVASTETGDLEMKIRLQEITLEKIKISMAQEIADKGGDDPAVRLKMLDYESAQIQLKSLRNQLERTTLV